MWRWRITTLFASIWPFGIALNWPWNGYLYLQLFKHLCVRKVQASMLILTDQLCFPCFSTGYQNSVVIATVKTVRGSISFIFWLRCYRIVHCPCPEHELTQMNICEAMKPCPWARLCLNIVVLSSVESNTSHHCVETIKRNRRMLKQVHCTKAGAYRLSHLIGVILPMGGLPIIGQIHIQPT